MRAANGASMVNVATDGETYGHHFKFGDLCIAHALELEAPAAGFRLTNYGEYLDEHPATAEVKLAPGEEGKGTSWSCVHGVARWARDCGCHTAGEAGWNQKWREPLRAALNFLRDAAARDFEEFGAELFADPWQARNESIQLILDPQGSREAFLAKYARRNLVCSRSTGARLCSWKCSATRSLCSQVVVGSFRKFQESRLFRCCDMRRDLSICRNNSALLCPGKIFSSC